MYCPLKFIGTLQVLNKEPDLAVCETQDCRWWVADQRACAVHVLAFSSVQTRAAQSEISDDLQEISNAPIWGL